MKKAKPLSLHHIQTNSPSTTKKKSPLTIKQKLTKQPLSKKSTQTITIKHSPQPQDYIIINDNIYSANTFTQRNCYDQFLTKVKKEKQQQRKSFLFKQTLDQSHTAKLKKGKQSTKKKFKKLSPQDLIKCMSLDEKREMFYKLQQEIKSTNGVNILPVDLPSLTENNKQSQPCSTQSFENDLSERMRLDSERQRQQKFQMLEQKLQTLKMQLLFKWESQFQRLQDMYRKGKISQKQKQNKCVLIQKLKDHKLKIIECTKTLFQKILQQDNNNNQEQQMQRKNDKIEAILQSLHSLPSLQSLKDLQIDKQPNIDHLKVSEKSLKANQNNVNLNQQRGFKKQQRINNNINQQPSLFNSNNNKNNNKIITTIDSSPLEIVQDTGHGIFLSEFNQDIENKKIKIRQQLVSPLGFMNSSPSKQKFGQFQQINTIVNTGYNNIPTRSEQFLRQLLEFGDAPKNDHQQQQKFSINNKNKFGHSLITDNESNKMSLKLDLRLDQIVFGRDEYPQCEKDQHSKTHFDNSAYNNNDFNNNNKIDQYLKPNIDNLQKLNLKIEERIIRDINSKSNKKKSLIQFTQQKIQLTQQQEQIIEEIQVIEDKKPSIVEKISFPQLQTKTAKFNIEKDTIKQQKVSLVELSQYKKPQQTQIPKQEFKIPLNLQFNKKQKEVPVIAEQQEQQQKQQQKPSIINQQLPPIHKQEPTNQEYSLENLQCHQVSHTIKPTIDIPMILSQQKMETLALQQNRLFRQNIDKRIAFQMGCIQLQPAQPSSPHFTTLVDVNSYIVGLYQFMMKKYMSSLVDSLNIPYGKSAVDKLYSLHTQGFVLQESYNQMNNILSESHFKEYQRQMTLTVRRCSQYQTAHNRAVFEAFTKAINVYRPYYELQGQVYPWIVSQKGITFYEITEDNIEQVFQKSKIKVLEYCTSLCGIHSPSQVKNDEQLAIVNNKNEQNLNKIVKAQTLQQFQEWKIRFVNFDCLIKLLLGKILFAQIINQVTSEIQSISNKREILTE